MLQRINQLRTHLDALEVDAVLISKPENRRYYTNFTGTTGYVLITADQQIFATDFRYVEQAKKQCKDFDIEVISNEYTIYDLLKKLGVKTLGIEDDFITYQATQTLKKHVADLKLVALKGRITKLRMIKDEHELELIAKAAEVTDKAYNHIIKIIKVGMTEREVAVELEHFMKKNGAERMSFDFIVASGVRSSMPHGVASEKVIEKGDFVTIDMGCMFKGYCSDMTRTFVMGKATEKQKEVYNTVLKAQEAVLNAIKPGVTGFDLDKIARDLISEHGYGEYFGHGLGHGVGLEVHELPRLAPVEMAKIAMQPGMVITDEPGIYIPEFGGVRIEDLIVVTEEGKQILSKSPKKLIEINNEMD